MNTPLHIVFDGMPGPEGPRLIEVEDQYGRSVNAGTWRWRPDGYAELVITPASPSIVDQDFAEMENRPYSYLIWWAVIALTAAGSLLAWWLS